MRIIQITPSAGNSFYCENCLRDAALAKAKAYRATATEVRDGSVVTTWTLAANDIDSARERAREQAARRGFCSDIFVRVERIED